MAVDRFLAEYLARHPVDATFIGVHEHDARLPEWSEAGRQAEAHELHAMRRELERAHPLPKANPDDPDWGVLAHDPVLLDAEVARANLEVRAFELESGNFRRGDPALWTGEAIFGAVALMLRPFAPASARAATLERRLAAVGPFLARAEPLLTVGSPAPWVDRAVRECAAARRLFTDGLARWVDEHAIAAAPAQALRGAAAEAVAAFDRFAADLGAANPVRHVDGVSIGAEGYARLLERGHFVEEGPSTLLARAERALAEAEARLAEVTREVAGTSEELQRRIAADHAEPARYMEGFAQRWLECRELARTHDLVSWPDEWPLRYVPQPAWARTAAADLYFLHYRAPSPFDRYDGHDYLVAPLSPDDPPEQVERTLQAWNRSQVTLNHVVHHGALGHHVQNWHAATRSRSRIGRIAAVDGASRIAMLLGGTMAEGWACYATDLAEECGFLTPLERAAEQQSRVRQLARAVMDIRLHCGERTFGESVTFMRETLGLAEAAATAEVTKASMFPATPVMYWVGTQGIHDLREVMRARLRSDFSLRTFHDTLLSWGSLPVPLVAKLMLAGRSA